MFLIISLIIFFLIITGISLFIPSHVRISKAITVIADKKTVMNQLSDVAKWREWYPGADSSEIFFSNGKPNGLKRNDGHIFINIININDTSIVASAAARRFKKIITGWKIISGSSPNDVSIQWYMDFYMEWYPWEKLGSLILEKTYGVQMEKGLVNLKKLLEK